MKGTKSIGGTDGMHVKPDRHPFASSWGNHTGVGKGRTVGVSPAPGGEGNKISANAEMRKKRPLNGPGDAQ